MPSARTLKALTFVPAMWDLLETAKRVEVKLEVTNKGNVGVVV